MNEQNYAEMIEIPVCTTGVETKKRKFRFGGTEAVKRKLIKAVNGEDRKNEEEIQPVPETPSVSVTTVKREKKGEKKNSGFDVIAAQAAVVVVLLLTVILTNIFWQDSGINKLVKSVFTDTTQTLEENDVTYDKFSATSPVRTSDLSLSEGVMTFSGKGSIYSVADGVVSKVEKTAENAEKTNLTVTYSLSFSAVISGVDFAYYGVGDKVYKSVPLCYSAGGDVKIYLYDNGKLLTDYTLDNGKIIWQS